MEGLISADRFQISKLLDKTTAKQLSDNEKLKVIQFFDYKPDKETLENLNQVLFKTRKDLTLRIYSHSDFWSDISFLNYLTEVERLDWNSDIFGSFEPLYQLRKLVHLGLGFRQTKTKISFEFLKDFNKTLESLNLQGDYKDLIDIVPNLKLLKSIWFASTKLHNFDFLENLPIETFGNYGSRVESFEYLKNLKGLKKIRIQTNSKIENVDYIKDLYNLEEIELLYLSKITKLPKCSHLKKLKKIVVFECNRLENIEEIKKLDNCYIFAGGNLIRKMFKGNFVKKGF